MNICLISEEFPLETPKGGIATYQYILAKTLKELGHNVHVICKTIEFKDKFEVFEGINLHYISEPNIKNKILNVNNYRHKVFQKILALEKNIDIFEVADWGAEAHYYLKYKKRKKPVIIKLHTPYFVWNKYNKVKYTKVSRMIEREEIEDLRLCDNIYACSESIKNIVNEKIKISYPINVIHNPVIIKKEFIDYSVMKEEVILFVGSLEERKGVLRLAEELNTFFKNNIKYKVIFIGKDTKRNSLGISTKEYIKKILKPEYLANILFLGHLNQLDIEKWFKKAKFAIFPSLYENFPYVLLEAIENGCPAIGSCFGGMAEVIIHNKNGWLCNPNFKGNISTLLSQVIMENNFNKIATAAYDTLKKYERAKIARQTLAIYKDTIKNFYKNKGGTDGDFNSH